ncbi:MAG: hypothetical protein RKU31_01735 [Deltaproteobacteria bacterium]|jgi:threonine/homoserine efflux transporter RhtA
MQLVIHVFDLAGALALLALTFAGLLIVLGARAAGARLAVLGLAVALLVPTLCCLAHGAVDVEPAGIIVAVIVIGAGYLRYRRHRKVVDLLRPPPASPKRRVEPRE